MYAPKFFLKFDPSREYTCRRAFLFGGRQYNVGDRFPLDNVSLPKAKGLWASGRIVPVMKSEKPLTIEEKSDIFEIKQAGPAWVKAYKNGKQIGKAVRTREEAQEIINEHS
jgi:hypothetical protein